MGIKPNFTEEDVKKRFDEFLKKIEKSQIRRLQMLGEMCASHAKSIPADIGFRDQTGNLRSSIGYAVFKNGIAVHEGYTDTNAGATEGKELANKVGTKYTNGICLVVTAGMNYAIYLEARGRDVLTSAEIMAKNELPKMLEALRKNINRALEL